MTNQLFHNRIYSSRQIGREKFRIELIFGQSFIPEIDKYYLVNRLMKTNLDNKNKKRTMEDLQPDLHMKRLVGYDSN